ncbi:hypothetical protein LX95_01819 [Mesonia algae]|uniref:Uncharacterized protein n=1 Tax=Mesonia algae TaxID=213248 RepID=A0A2W7I1D3_9FLAO|nr:hypothetical protein [Mesonia algae]PZW40751.1 hypothetical protein LX95_01819 [Mesonia algae]
MVGGEQHEKHPVGDKATKKKYNANKEKQSSPSSKNIWTKLKNFFLNK